MTNTIQRHESKQHLSNVVEGGGLVFTAGVLAKNLDQDIKGQTKEILVEIDRLLRLVGSDKSKILSASLWVPDIRLRNDLNEIWIGWVDPKHVPARACVESKLADPKALVEIAVVALK